MRLFKLTFVANGFWNKLITIYSNYPFVTDWKLEFFALILAVNVPYICI